MLKTEKKPDYECPNRAFFLNEVLKAMFKSKIIQFDMGEAESINVVIDLIYSVGVKDGERNVMDSPADYLAVERS